MPDYEVGEAWVSLQPSARGFGQKAKKDLAEIDLSKSVDLDADKAQLEAAIKQVRGELKALDREKVSPAIDFDIAVAEARAEEIKAKLDELSKVDATPKVNVQIAEANRELDKVTRQLEVLGERRATVDVDAATAAAQAQLEQLTAKLTEVDRLRAQPRVDADVTAARTRLDEVNAQLARLSGITATPDVELEVARARQEALALTAELDRLGAMRPSVQVDADIAAASAKLALLHRQLSEINGRGVRVSANVDGGGNAGIIVTGLAAALGAVAAAGPAAAAGLAVAAGAAGALGQGAGAAALGLSGISDALSAVESDEKSAATSSASAASSRTNSAKQIESAQASLTQAVTSANRAAITGGEQVADAARNEARTRITAAQQVTSARRAQADAIVTAGQRVADAERSVGRAQDSVRFAQESLTQARRDAVTANDDLFYSLNDTALAERRAELNLRKAREAAAAGWQSGDQEELQLNIDEAAGNLDEVRYRYQKLRDQQAAFTRTGVDGSQQVISATRALTSAQDSAQDAARGLTQAQVDGAKQVRDAAEASAQAQQQASWQVADAATATARAARDSAWSQADAALGVQSAQRALAQAYETTGAAGASGAKQAQYALSKLSPAGREFVGFLTDEWKPAWENTSHAIAEEMLPGIERGMRSTLGLQPVFNRGFAESGRIVGDLAARGGALAASPAFRADFGAILDSNNRSLSNMGDAGLSLFGAMTSLYTVSLPVIERFTRLADYSSQAFESWILGKRASGELESSLQSAGDTLMWVGGVLIDVGGDVVTVAGNLAPLGAVVLETVRGVSDLVAELSELGGPVGTSVVVGLGGAALVASKLGTAMKGMALADGASGLRGFANIASTVFVPSNLAATSGMQRFGGAVETAAGKMGAGEAAAAKWGSRLSGMASSLPLLGVALAGVVALIDSQTVSTGEAADALAQGGKAAADMRAELAQNDELYSRDTVNGYLSSLLGINTTTAEANAQLEEQRSKMSNLEAAQSRATQAQGDYELAVRDFGAASPQAAAAMANLRDRTRDVEIAQISVREKVDLATAALLYQRDQILSGLDANLRARQAASQLAKDQQALGDAIKGYGASSQEAKDAGLQLEQSQLRAAQAARDSAGGQGAYVQSIRDMVAATKGELTPTLAGLVGSLDWAGLSAAGAQVKIDDAGRAVATFPDGKTVVLDANTSPAVGQINFVKGLVDGTRGTIGIDADPGPAVATVGGFKLTTDATTGVVTINGNITPAEQQRLGIQAKTDGTTGTMWIDGNPVPCDGKLNGARISVDRTTGVMSIDANTRPANDASRAAHDGAARPVTFDVDADTAKADGRLKGWLLGLSTIPIFGSAFSFAASLLAGGGLVGVNGLARGGLAGYPGGGLLRGPGTATSDSILGLDRGGVPTAAVSTGEYVVRAAAVRKVGVPALDAINGLRAGGLVGYAGGGTVDPTAGAAGPARGAAVAAPTGDPAAVAATASATDSLTGSMTAASLAAAGLTPELATLAATQSGLLVPATAAVALGQQQLVTAGITPLVGSLLGSLFPTLAVYDQQLGVTSVGANTALQAAQTSTQLSTTSTAANTATNTAAMTASTTGMSLASQAQLAGLRLGQDYTQSSTYAMAVNNAGQNNAMMSSTGAMSATNQGHLAALRGAQGVTVGSTVAFADSWRAQLGRTVPDSADPIRWVLMFPMRSIVDAWNNLDGQFALNKHVNPVLPNFAVGGPIAGPGSGTSDSILARVSDGEFVVRASVAQRVPHFLNALNGGQAEALRAAGGARANPFPGFAAGGAIAAAQFAQQQAGKPYIWGGVGPAGYDCSGLWSAITNVARGQAPYRRLGVAAGVPWPGFVNGLSSSLTMGANSHHTAGTIAGLNAEARDFGIPVLVGGAAAGADSAQFTRHVSLPQVGGQFVSGGPGGGGGFDPTPLVDDAFRKAYAEIGDIPKFFGPSAQVARDQGVARAGADGVKAAAMAKLQEMFASSGLFGPTGAGAPFVVRQISDAARAYRLGVDGATIGVATGLVESNLTNLPGGDRDSVGVFQQRPSQGWGSIQECMNVLHAAGSFFSRFPPQWRSMAPGDVAQSVQRSAFPAKYGQRMGQARGLVAQYGGAFDNGGPLNPGVTLAYNGTGAREQVLDNVETRNYDTLSRLMGPSGVRVDPAAVTPPPVVIPDRIRLSSDTAFRLDGDGLLRIIDGHLEGLADAITDGS